MNEIEKALRDMVTHKTVWGNYAVSNTLYVFFIF